MKRYLQDLIIDMDISIILVNFNTKDVIFSAINSCLEEGSKVKKEIIVVDNGSMDGSYEFLREKFRNIPDVILIKNKENLGFSKAVNIALKISKGSYKFLLNSDTKITKHIISDIISFFERDKKIGVIGTKLILPDGTTQKSCFNFPSFGNAISEYWLGKKNAYSSFYNDNITEVDAVVGASFLIAPEAYKKVGLFDEKYFMYFEDLDYCRRVKKAGFKVIYYPKASVFHHHGLSGSKLVEYDDQWRRLIPSSKIYHGLIKHYLITFIIWSAQKFRKYNIKV